MKVLIKAKQAITLVTFNEEVVDSHRPRLITNDVNNVRNWKGRNLVEVYGSVEDKYTDAQFLEFYEKDNKTAVENFLAFTKEGPKAKEEEVVVEEEPVVEVKEEKKPAVRRVHKFSK